MLEHAAKAARINLVIKTTPEITGATRLYRGASGLIDGFGGTGGLMKNKRILVVGSGRRGAAIAAALIAAGADVVQANELPITRRPEITGAWFDELAPLGCIEDKRKTYGPPKKGRGGKVRRWRRRTADDRR